MAITVSVLGHYHPPSGQLLEIHSNIPLAHLSTKLVSCLNTSLPLASTMQACGVVKKGIVLSILKAFVASFKIQ